MDPPRRVTRRGGSRTSTRTQSGTRTVSLDRDNKSSRSSSTSTTSRASRRDYLEEANPHIDLEPEIDNIESDNEDEHGEQPPLANDIDQTIQAPIPPVSVPAEGARVELPLVPPPIDHVVVVEVGHAAEVVMDIERDGVPDGVRDAEGPDEIAQVPEPPPERAASPWERVAVEMRNLRNGRVPPPRAVAAARVVPPRQVERRAVEVVQVHRDAEPHPQLDEFGLPIPPLRRQDAFPPPGRRSRSPSYDDLMERLERIRRYHDSPAPQPKQAIPARAPLASSSRTTAAGDDFRPAKPPVSED